MTKQQGDNESPTPLQSGTNTDVAKSVQVEQSAPPKPTTVPSTPLYEQLRDMY